MEPGKVIESGTLIERDTKLNTAVERIDHMLTLLDDLVIGKRFDAVAIERPETWGAYKSMASSRSGSLQILTLLTGALVQWALFYVEVGNVRFPKVSEWKGQLPKRITRARMTKKYKRSFKTDDEADAVGIGDFILGKECHE